MKSTLAPQLPVTTATVAPAAPAAAKPTWSAPSVECHRTGAEVTAYAARTTR
ncbi:pyrroloquinoline quinone precursor peptide PqqA [Kitasatospora sp. NPDC089913]|uniref:pyrroloquinoline quinone precursor peptide PqqA n=1 Tax=Streptomycetaceae TaxID=2062 RepID=UPI00087CECB7|nr:pyrroloquinoline quinone precursor peptide PqqA [Streptomyces sp. TLI_053]SDT01919.1 coenzyme PQQ precursor peptide PqqA [Streptomyces sp. TLI_053]